MGDGDDFKGLCTVHRSLVRAVRQGASVDLRIFISSDWRSMGVTPGLDAWMVAQVCNVPSVCYYKFLVKMNLTTYLNSTLQRFVIEVVGT